MANVIESAMFFTNGKTAVKMAKNGDLTAIGAQSRLVPFCPNKFLKSGNDPLKYATSRTNVQNLEYKATFVMASFANFQNDLNKARKFASTEKMKGEGFDEAEVEQAYEAAIDNYTAAKNNLDVARSDMNAIKAVYNGGAAKAVRDAKAAEEKAKKAESAKIMREQIAVAKFNAENLVRRSMGLPELKAKATKPVAKPETAAAA